MMVWGQVQAYRRKGGQESTCTTGAGVTLVRRALSRTRRADCS